MKYGCIWCAALKVVDTYQVHTTYTKLYIPVKRFHSSIAHLLGLTLFSFKYRSPVSLRMVRTYFHSSIAHLELVHTYFHSSIAQLENHGTTYTNVTNDILHR